MHALKTSKHSLICWALLTFILASCGGNNSDKLFPVQKELSKAEVSDSYTLLSFEKAKLDLLFVIDNSGSMSTHQERFGRNIDLFLQKFMSRSDVDIHFAIISTSGNYDNSSRSGGGRFIGEPPNQVVSNSSPSYIETLRFRLKLGTGGSGREMFFYPIKSALWGEASLLPSNQGFLRPDAHLAIVMLTDTEDQSPVVYKGDFDDRGPKYEVRDFVNDLLKVKGGRLERISTVGVLIPSGREMCARDDGDPARLEDFIDRTGGTVLDLCSDFGPKLASVGSDLYERVRNRIFLSDIPYVPSIKLIFETGEEVSKSFWSYNPDQNSIELDGIPQEKAGLKISIEYKPATR